MTDTATATPLGTTGVWLAPLALGAMILGTTTDIPTSYRLLDHVASELSGRLTAPDGSPAIAMVDTADCYCWWDRPDSRGGDSESLIGRWLAISGRRDDIFLATKGTGQVWGHEGIWNGASTPDWNIARKQFVGASAAVLRPALDSSLTRLGVDHIDLYYVHVDDLATPLEETLETLASFVTAGKVRYLGWSNVSTDRLETIRALCEANGWPLPVAVQQQHSYLRPRPDAESLSIVGAEQRAYLAAHPDQTLVAYSPILKGIYDDPARLASHYLMEPYAGPEADARLAALTATAADLGVKPNALVLAWLLAQRSPRVLPMIGPRTWEQYIAGLDALDIAVPESLLD